LRNGFRSELAHRTRLVLIWLRGARTNPAAAVPVPTAVVMLIIACTAGYGIFGPQGRTMQAQIASGARFSSTTVPSAQRPRLAVRWWVEPGRMLFRESPHVKPPRQVPPPGATVMAIGDSVMLASTPELAHAMPGIYINAKVSRHMFAGISLVDRLARANRLRRVVIVGLGTNGPVTASQVSQLRTAIGDRWLVLINTFVPRSWEHEVNATLARAASHYPNVLLVNWHNVIEHHQSLLWSDNIHPQPVGGKLYASVVRKVVLSALRKLPRLHMAPPRHVPDRGFLRHARYATLYSWRKTPQRGVPATRRPATNSSSWSSGLRQAD